MNPSKKNQISESDIQKNSSGVQVSSTVGGAGIETTMSEIKVQFIRLDEGPHFNAGGYHGVLLFLWKSQKIINKKRYKILS